MHKVVFSAGVMLVLSVWVLVACEPSDNLAQDLKEKEWEVVSIIEPGSSFAEQAENTYVLNFTDDTTYTLSLDVNHCSGDYRVKSDSKIEFSGAACTEVCCDSEFARTLVRLLPGMTDYRFDSGYLILKGEGRIKLK